MKPKASASQDRRNAAAVAARTAVATKASEAAAYAARIAAARSTLTPSNQMESGA